MHLKNTFLCIYYKFSDSIYYMLILKKIYMNKQLYLPAIYHAYACTVKNKKALLIRIKDTFSNHINVYSKAL